MNQLHLTIQMIKYNAKIIFGNKLLYFLIAALIVFLAVTIGNLAAGNALDNQDAFSLLLFIGALLVFYPLTFGIQSDKDARTLEIIFGIPDYRYRVWLMRMLMIFAMAFVMMLALAWLLNATLVDYKVLPTIINVMYPLMFLGFLSFFLSTIVKSGSGTAVIIIIISVVMLIIFQENDYNTKFYNVFFNPYDIPSDMTEILWNSLMLKNHLFLAIGSVVFFLSGLLNLQHREKFLG